MSLNVEDLVSGYGGSTVLHGVSLYLAAGETLAVIGRNGVGKTTLALTLAGLLPATRGRVDLQGIDLTALPTYLRARSGIGYVPQGRRIFGRLTVAENLAVAAHALGLRGGHVEEVLDEFPTLRAKLGDRGSSLSGGQQQLLALARCMVAQPKVVILDEPSEGVQPSIIDEIGEAIQRLRSRRRLSVLLIEQNLDFANRLADRSCLMDDGQIVREVRQGEIFSDPMLRTQFMTALDPTQEFER
jgi:urea ABC transporter ATP-binding protein UrtE